VAGLPEDPLSAAALPWQSVCDQAPIPLALLDLHGRYCYVNQAMCRLLGYRREQLLGRTTRDITPAEDPALDHSMIAKLVAGHAGADGVEKRYMRPDGSVIWVLQSSSIIRDPNGEPCFILAQFQDITTRHESETLWRNSFDNAAIGMALLDLQGRWTTVNDALCALLGYDRDKLVGSEFAALTYPEDQEQGLAAFADLVEGRQDTVTLEKRLRHQDGHPLWVLIRSRVVPGPDGHPAFLVSQYEEIGNGRMADEHLAHLALHDPLTGLANRALLFDRLAHQLAELTRSGGILVVLVADVDELKPINDRYGHAAGDEVLIAAAHGLLSAVRSGDTVARIGGDEFVVAGIVADVSAAELLRRRIAQHLDVEIPTSGRHLRMRASVGLAVTDDPTTSVRDLLHRADQDMYLNKRGHNDDSPASESP
jgi:diguanylate cyclase (GGDEF)-like protein/PAS domain S-box-containing protein